MVVKNSASAIPKFPDLKTPDQLKKFLCSKGPRHKAFYHYTNRGALKGIIASQKLYLSRSDTLNDSLEGNKSKTKNAYIASFVFREPESLPMWAMYAFPYQDGLRLRFKRAAMNQVIRQFNKSPKVYSAENGLVIPGCGKGELSVMDVAYAHDNYLEYNGDKNINNLFFDNVKKSLSKDTILNWAIKHDAWIAEREVRLILKLEKAIPDKKVAIDFSSALKSFEIMCGPCMNVMEIDPIVKKIASISISDYWNRTYFRSCQGCQHRTKICRERNIIGSQTCNSDKKTITISIV